MSSPDHLRTFHGLCVPVVPVQPALQMGISLGLEKVVIMTLLVKEMQVIVLAVVANLFHHRANAGLPVANELGVLQLFALEILHHSLLLRKSALKFRYPGSCL